MQPGDVDEVARLYRSVFGRGRSGPTAARDEIRRFYLDGPFRDPDLPSLVHVDDAGLPSGFIGVHTVPYRIGARRVRAAFCGALLSANRDRDPLAGARLLKAFLAGPQDVSFSETANAVSQGMWERLGGTVLAPYSMEWVRVLRPAGFMLAFASLQLPVLRVLTPLGRITDRALMRSGRSGSTLLNFGPEAKKAALIVEDIGQTGFAELMRQFSEERIAKPDWSNGYLEHVLGTGLDKPAFGWPVMAAVRTKGGEPLGAFLYHLRPNGIARVLQIMFQAGRAGVVLDQLFVDAMARGAVALRGRTEPAVLAAMPGRHMMCVAASSTVIHARDGSLINPFETGDCLLNGLAGERWSRFFGTDLS